MHVSTDGLRRLAVELGSAAGLPRASATVWAQQLSWCQTRGFAKLGYRGLAASLANLESGVFDVRAEPTIVAEKPALAVLAAGKCLPALVIARAGELAWAKARESGAAVIQLTGLPGEVPGAWALGELSIGPFAATFDGPDQKSFESLPMAGGAPVVRPAGPAIAGCFPLRPGEALLFARLVGVAEPLEAFPGRVASSERKPARASRRNFPKPVGPGAREITIESSVVEDLRRWAEKLGVYWASFVPIPGE